MVEKKYDWNLIAQRFPHPGRHDDHCMLAFADMLDHLQLLPAKVVVAEILLKDVNRLHVEFYEHINRGGHELPSNTQGLPDGSPDIKANCPSPRQGAGDVFQHCR